VSFALVCVCALVTRFCQVFVHICVYSCFSVPDRETASVIICYSSAGGVVVSFVCLVNEVNQRWARLVLRTDKPSRYVFSQHRLSLPSLWVGKMRTSFSTEGKGMVHTVRG